MSIKKSTIKELYYTSDHDWIDFQGSVAYIGICKFKLAGFKKIQQLLLNESPGLLKRGDTIASLAYQDWLVEVHMPVDGKLIQFNDKLKDNQDILLKHNEGVDWIALVVPTQPYERRDLLLPLEYQIKVKTRYTR